MVQRARVTTKGQVTLPVALRRRLDISAGDDLEFEEAADGALVRVVHRRRLADFFGALETDGTVASHDDERRAAARGRGARDAATTRRTRRRPDAGSGAQGGGERRG